MKIFLTKDFYLSAFLVANDIQLQDYVKEDVLTTFKFNDSEKLQKLVRDFYAGTSIVHTTRYGIALKNLKSIIRNTNTNTNANNSYTNSGSFR
jgi:predicted SpoU family rRNA methylase